eukprot:9500785-Pyramimonas_sp.AAC.1
MAPDAWPLLSLTSPLGARRVAGAEEKSEPPLSRAISSCPGSGPGKAASMLALTASASALANSGR